LRFFWRWGIKGHQQRKVIIMAKSSKYSDAMVAAIEAAAKQAGALNLDLCVELAATPMFEDAGITARGIIAKARTMGLPYQKVKRLTKTGQPVIRKDEIVVKIEDRLGVNGLDSLSKAEKPALLKLYSALKEMA
jgi:hypothetical protein